jgi:hypothetical protein
VFRPRNEAVSSTPNTSMSFAWKNIFTMFIIFHICIGLYSVIAALGPQSRGMHTICSSRLLSCLSADASTMCPCGANAKVQGFVLDGK